MKYLTFALTKGRLASKTLEMLEQLGITCEEMKEKDSRKLVFVNEELKVFPRKRTGCSDLCRIWSSRYRSCRQRYDRGRRTQRT